MLLISSTNVDDFQMKVIAVSPGKGKGLLRLNPVLTLRPQVKYCITRLSWLILF